MYVMEAEGLKNSGKRTFVLVGITKLDHIPRPVDLETQKHDYCIAGKFGGLAVFLPTAKAKNFSIAYTMILYRTAKFVNT